MLAQAVSGVMRRKSGQQPILPRSMPRRLPGLLSGRQRIPSKASCSPPLQRDKTGEGQQVAVSLYNSMIAMQMQEGTTHLDAAEGSQLGRLPTDGVRDNGQCDRHGRRLQTEPLRDICEALEIEDLSKYPHYKDFDAQTARRPELQAIFRENS